MSPDLELRERRVRFKHPVRVTAIDGEPRAWRTLSANLSHRGLFVRMPQPLEPGTRVALSLEVKGLVLPFAQGEVRWCRRQASELEGRVQGCGVRFTGFLHPRAQELVAYLVETLETGRPLKAAPAVVRRRRAALVAAAVLAIGATLGSAWLAQVGDPVGAQRSVTAATAERVVPPDDAPALSGPEQPSTPVVLEGRTREDPDEGRGPVERDEQPARDLSPDVAPQSAAAAGLPSATGSNDVDVTAAPGTSAELAEPADHAPHGPVAAPAVRTATSGNVSLPSGAARRLTWTSAADGLWVQPELIGAARVARVFALADPPRVVFDIEGGAPAHSLRVPVQSARFSQVRLGRQGAQTRVVVDLTQAPQQVTTLEDRAVLQF